VNDIATAKQKAEARSRAAKKAAKTRKENAEAEEAKRKEEEEAAAAATASNEGSSSDDNPDQVDGSDEGNGQTGDNLGDQSSGDDGDSDEKAGPRYEPLSYKPTRTPLENAGLDQHAAEEDRQAELDAEREEHNRRTGDPTITGFKY
jgi:hypothetical protein